MPLFQKKYFCRLYCDFYIEPNEKETRHHTTDRKKSLVIPIAGADGCFHGLGKPHLLLKNDALRPQKAKG